MKRTPRILAAAAGVLALGACTPQQYIAEVFGPAAGEATRVAECESGLNPSAVSPGGGNHGLFQINNVHRENFTAITGQPWEAVYDPYYNSQYARRLYDGRGWAPWTCQP